jgi:hypothetical protein
VAVGALIIVMVATPAPVVLAQDRSPSGSELRDTYPLRDAAPRATPTANPHAAPPAHQADSGSSVQPVIAAGLALLAFAAGFAFGLRPVRRRLPAALRVTAGGQR